MDINQNITDTSNQIYLSFLVACLEEPAPLSRSSFGTCIYETSDLILIEEMEAFELSSMISHDATSS